MKNLYLLFLFIGCSFFAGAQGGKSADPPSDPVEVKVLKFYPNPAISVINFEFLKPVDRNCTLQIFNFTGKKVFEVTNVSQKNTIPLTDFFEVFIFSSFGTKPAEYWNRASFKSRNSYL